MKLLDVASGLIVHTDGRRVLMDKRYSTSLRPGMWELPGGKRDRYERLPQTLKRELMEELGVVVEVGAPLVDIRLDFEVRARLTLFPAKIISGKPRALTATRIEWIAPLDAIKHRACTPSTYLFYPAIRKFLLTR